VRGVEVEVEWGRKGARESVDISDFSTSVFTSDFLEPFLEIRLMLESPKAEKITISYSATS
jgi:hypothetical protein